MRETDLKNLEFDKFLNYLSEYTVNELTKKKILNIKPSIDIKEVEDRVAETKAVLDILYKEGYFPLVEYPDISKALELLAIEESVLSPFELLDIASILNIARELKNFLAKNIKDYEAISKYYKNLYPSRETERIIYDSIDKSGMIKDSASRDLANIRRSIREVESKIKSILENILNSYKYQDILQEKIITVRKDRFVIPVRQNFSSKMQGIIHDRSASGQTIYLEPVNVVELNNKLSDLKIREHIEIRKILKFLTDLLRNRYQHLKDTFNAIINFDYLYTLAKFGKEINGTFPKISDRVNLIEAKHPIFVINKRDFKPLNIKIGPKKKGLVLTGSNTGGKTITLKTLGLSAFLFQSGIPIAIEDGSELPVFDWVYSDIGDMQSIEQDLSTYSAHIKNINEILKLATNRSLVLMDELIAGTDPDEASAIGIGIMERLKEIGAYVLITTHFKPLKIYALSSDYYEVASVGFDKNTLSPTYTIHYKTIGQSMAFYIAEKLDFDKKILEIAEKYMDKASLELNKAIDKLEVYKDELEKELKEVSQLKAELKENKEKYEQLKTELEEYKKEKWKEAIKEINEYISNVREEGYKLIEEIKQKGAGKKLEKFLQEKKAGISELSENLEEENVAEFNIGDKVKVKGGSSVGEIISIREDKANVKFKKFKMWVNLKDLEKVEEKVGIKPEKKKISFNIRREKTGIKNEINLIGKTKEEAIEELSRFLDKAVLEGFSTIRIIHGYGSGILRKAVREYLDRLPYDIEYKDAPYSEGGMGVTVVNIK